MESCDYCFYKVVYVQFHFPDLSPAIMARSEEWSNVSDALLGKLVVLHADRNLC